MKPEIDRFLAEPPEGSWKSESSDLKIVNFTLTRFLDLENYKNSQNTFREES
jgi:hypothetical protein